MFKIKMFSKQFLITLVLKKETFHKQLKFYLEPKQNFD